MRVLKPRFKSVFLIAGLALLGLILWRTDLTGLGGMLARVGILGFLAVVAVYLVEHAMDAAVWQWTLPSAGLGPRWLGRLFDLRMIGEAFNVVTPAVSAGGEPVKAVLLNRCYGIGYAEGAASLIITKTINIVALLAFLGIGFLFITGTGVLSPAEESAIGTGLALLAAGILGFLAVQRFRLASRLAAALGRVPGFGAVQGLLAHIEELDARFAAFYGGQWRRFAASLVMALANWTLGVVEVLVTARFLGQALDFAEAWMIESAAQLVRAATFYVPASIGAQEGAFLVVGAFFTGSPVSALAIAAVRRARELVWVLWGFVLYWRLKPEDAPRDGAANNRS